MGAINVLSYAIVIVSVLIGVVFPLVMSQWAGGWVRKYTSATPFFQSDIPDMAGKVTIVTGANTGIGYETALEIARNGGYVIMAARSEHKGSKAVADVQATIGAHAKVKFLQLDLGSFASIRKFAESFKKLNLPLHTLVLNAGIMKSPGAVFVGQDMFYGFELTKDGLEGHIGVNHVGHFYLTNLLLDVLKKSGPSRVVSVSSAAEQAAYDAGIRPDLWEEKGADYEDGRAYGQSKLANILFARELAARMENEGAAVTAYSCHPGIIETELGRYMEEDAMSKGPVFAMINAAFMSIFNTALFSAQDGALNQLYLATSPSLPSNGGYYTPIATLDTPLHPQGTNATLQKLLWEESERIVKKIEAKIL